MTILACIDRSHFAASVCDHAAWAAKTLGVPVEVLHIIERHPDLQGRADRSGRLGVDTGEHLLAELVALDEQRNRLARESGRILLDDAAERLRGAGTSEVYQRLESGELADHLRDHERAARLVVIGKGGETSDRDVNHRARNLERLIRASHRPVLIASDTFRPIRRFLLAYDGGKSSGTAISFLVESGLLEHAEGTVLMVGRGDESDRSRVADAVRHLESAGITVTGETRDGEPESVIVDAVEQGGIDLLVMGAYGHSRIRQVMIGSTTTELLHRTPVPALVFH